MLVLSMLNWWYQRGWSLVYKSIGQRINSIFAKFSVSTLMRTLFAPWRRIIGAQGRRPIDYFYRLLDNLISRSIGFVIRVSVLLFSLMLMIVVSVLSVIQLISWPFIPPAAAVLLVIGLFKL